MKIGIIGLGKLGLPVALAIEDKGHLVYGFDSSPYVQKIVKDGRLPYKEAGAQELLYKSKLEICTVGWLVENCDIIFLAVQTPHEEKYEGITRIPQDRADFDYSYLRNAVGEVASYAADLKKDTTL